MTRFDVFEDVATLHEAAAAHIAEAARSALEERDRFLLVLAGGTTPRGTYHRLASSYSERLDWSRVHVFWGDDRCVPPDHEESNYRLAAESLLQHVSLPPSNIHRIRGEEPPGRAAALYDRELRRFFGVFHPGDLPAGHGFDLVLLGIGADGHTASLFPDSRALDATGWAIATPAPEGVRVRERVTLTLPAINRSREALFLATGSDKRDAVAEALATTDSPASVPAGLVDPHDTVRWLLDVAAAPRGLRR
jgi:6-phosphogluconolactonase